MHKGLVLLASLASLTPAQAAAPPELSPALHATAPYGSGTYTQCMMTIYDASLWTDAPAWSMDAPFALSLHYHMDLNGTDIVERAITEMNDESPLSDDQIADYRARLTALLPVTVKDGDDLTALYMPGRDMKIYHNGKLMGADDNLEFDQRFLNIWLADTTSAPRLRRSLLHLNQEHQK